jgi:hypothetical protein
LLATRDHGISVGDWNTIAARASLVRDRCARGRRDEPAIIRSSVVLPQPEGPSKRDELARAHRRGRRRDGLRAGRVRLARVLDRDDVGPVTRQGVTFTLSTISSDHAFA